MINHDILAEQGGIVEPFCNSRHDTVYIITKFIPSTAFDDYDWTTKGIGFKLCVLRELLEALRTLHEAGYMHRNISERSLFLTSDDPPLILIGDHTQAVKAPTATGLTGPTHIRAPEMNGDEYDCRVDIWNVAFAAILTNFQEDYEVFTLMKLAQDESWYKQARQSLPNFANMGTPEGMIAKVLERMLSDRPETRPSVEEALANLPEFD